MERGEIVGYSLSVVTLVAGWLIGKKKEDIEVALKYREFYEKHINDLRKDIDTLSDKVQELINDIEAKDGIIESQKNNIKRWEENCIRLENLVAQERKENNKLIKQIKELQK